MTTSRRYHMSDRSIHTIKWLILLVPALGVGFWEHIRHDLLLPYLSMEAGNFMTPIIVFLINVTLSRKLFQLYDSFQQQLETERAEKEVLQERERIARHLHDGIAQSLFLCSVQLNLLKRRTEDKACMELEKLIRQVHESVRYFIQNLKQENLLNWKTKMLKMFNTFHLESGIALDMNINLERVELSLTAREKAEVFSILQEALTNVRKHSEARNVRVDWIGSKDSWMMTVADDGRGLSSDGSLLPNSYGVQIMKERAADILADLSLYRDKHETILKLVKRM